MHFADAAVFITIASVLHSFNISKALDDAGNEITPAQKFTGGILMQVQVSSPHLSRSDIQVGTQNRSNVKLPLAPTLQLLLCSANRRRGVIRPTFMHY